MAAVAMMLSYIEALLPPVYSAVPGIKLGLANIVTVYAVYHYRAYEVFMTVFVRILLAAVFCGNFMALIYSFSGSVFCLVGMLLLRKIVDEKHIWIASVLGAVLHNTGQMIAASAVLQTVQIWLYYPVLIVSGCLAGLFTGLCAQLLISRLKNRLDI